MSSTEERAVRLVVIMLFANLAFSVLFCALMLVFRQNVLDYQLARHPTVPRDALALTIWTRPLRVLIVTAVDVWLARRLTQGRPNAYRRVRWASLVGFLYVGWVILQGTYPIWLSVLAGGELVLLGSLVVAVNRPAVRAAFRHRDADADLLAPIGDRSSPDPAGNDR
jgi:hypothetical protein